MPLPWVRVTAQKSLLARQTSGWAAPLTNSYPPGAFFITAGTQGLAPGQPTGLVRQNKSGLQTSGDPRATGGYWNITVPSNVQAALTGKAPTLQGGSITNLGTADNTSILVLGLLAAGVAYAIWK